MCSNEKRDVIVTKIEEVLEIIGEHTIKGNGGGNSSSPVSN